VQLCAQAVIEKNPGHLPAHELRMIFSEDAAGLDRVRLPDVAQPR